MQSQIVVVNTAHIIDMTGIFFYPRRNRGRVTICNIDVGHCEELVNIVCLIVQTYTLNLSQNSYPQKGKIENREKKLIAIILKCVLLAFWDHCVHNS